MSLQPVILAGGSGTRLWPLSRDSTPKQFISLRGERSLLQETVARLEGLEDAAAPLLVCNERHRSLVASQLDAIGSRPVAVIFESVGRNTAPALTLAALRIRDECDAATPTDPVMLVLPADHLMKDVQSFQSAVRQGALMAARGYLVAVGVVPTSAHSGYGYIRTAEAVHEPTGTSLPADEPRTGQSAAVRRVVGFVEKPDPTAARSMLESEHYLWNSGILMVRASIWLALLHRYRPDIAVPCTRAHDRRRQDGMGSWPDPDALAVCPGDFVAYGIMDRLAASRGPAEPAGPVAPTSGLTASACRGAVVIPLHAGWSDVGDWASVWAEENRDDRGNAISGDVDAHDTRDCLLMGRHGKVIADGLDNVVVVATSDAVLITRHDRSQDVKLIPERLRAQHRDMNATHYGWTGARTVDSTPHSQVRVLTIPPGRGIAAHMHKGRTAHWIVGAGTARVSLAGKEQLLTEHQSITVPAGTWHRLQNPGSTPLVVTEVWSGTPLDEDEVVEDPRPPR